jgi:mannitol-1-phosphate/altronate dehydrogenase
VEKDDLLPFEEAKLYGHNAIHALIGYLARLRGMRAMCEAAADPAIMRVARDAFVNESGAALVKRYGGLGDPLFTKDGYAAYADDLLDRMTRPTLHDLVERICRDPARKLGYDDRFFGTMRLALDEGIEPVNMAIGAAAAVRAFVDQQGEDPTAAAADVLRRIWNRAPDARSARLIELTALASDRLGKSWSARSGSPNEVRNRLLDLRDLRKQFAVDELLAEFVAENVGIRVALLLHGDLDHGEHRVVGVLVLRIPLHQAAQRACRLRQIAEPVAKEIGRSHQRPDGQPLGFRIFGSLKKELVYG